MNILVVAHSENIAGGANRSLLMVINNLQKVYHHKITLLAPANGALVLEASKLGISTYTIPYKGLITDKKISIKSLYQKPTLYIRTLMVIFRAYIFSRKINSQKFDLVYTNDIICFTGFFISRFLNIPHVWHLRSLGEDRAFMPFAYKCFNSTNNINICISNYIKDWMCNKRGIKKDKLVMINNGVEVNNAIISKQNRTKGFHLLLTGRFVPEKKQTDAIKALAILIQRGYKDIYLHLAGSLSSRRFQYYLNEINVTIGNNNLSEKVIFEGEVSNMNLLRSKMNVELMCSLAEPFGRVTVEAMYSGLIVIGSNTGGTLDIIIDKYNGLLYKQGDVLDLANKIEMVYTDIALSNYLLLNSEQIIKKRFRISENVELINNVLTNSFKRI